MFRLDDLLSDRREEGLNPHGRDSGIVRHAVLTDFDSVEAVMKNVASYTEDRFGDKFTFQPFGNADTNEVIFVNSAVDEATMADWLEAMGDETGFREVVMTNMEIKSVELLDPTSDPRLDYLREGASQLRPLA